MPRFILALLFGRLAFLIAGTCNHNHLQPDTKECAQVAESDGPMMTGLGLEPAELFLKSIETYSEAISAVEFAGEKKSVSMAEIYADLATVHDYRSHDGDKSESFILFRRSLKLLEELDLEDSELFKALLATPLCHPRDPCPQGREAASLSPPSRGARSLLVLHLDVVHRRV